MSHGFEPIYTIRSCTEVYILSGHVLRYIYYQVMYWSIYTIRSCTEVYILSGHVLRYIYYQVMYWGIYTIRSCTEVYILSGHVLRYIYYQVMYWRVPRKLKNTPYNSIKSNTQFTPLFTQQHKILHTIQ